MRLYFLYLNSFTCEASCEFLYKKNDENKFDLLTYLRWKGDLQSRWSCWF